MPQPAPGLYYVRHDAKLQQWLFPPNGGPVDFLSVDAAGVAHDFRGVAYPAPSLSLYGFKIVCPVPPLDALERWKRALAKAAPFVAEHAPDETTGAYSEVLEPVPDPDKL